MSDKYQDLLTKLQTADESEREWIAMEFSLQNLTDVLQQAVWAAAIPHWFDHDFLNAVLGFQLKDSDFEALKELSFVEVFPERGFNVHERSRDLLLTQLWQQDKARFQKLSKRATNYCKKQNQNITEWKIEKLYNSLLSGNLISYVEFFIHYINWNNHCQFDKLENLTKKILEIINITKPAYQISVFSVFLQARIHFIYDNYSLAKELLYKALQKNSHLLQKQSVKKTNFFYSLVQGLLNYLLGTIYRELDENEKAKIYYQKSLLILKNILILGCFIEIPITHSLGIAHYKLAEYKQSLNCYQRSILVYKRFKLRIREIECGVVIADVYHSLSEYEKAINYYQKSLLFFQNKENRLGEALCLKRLGRVYSFQQKTELAFSYLKQSIQIYEEIGLIKQKAICIGELALHYKRQNQFRNSLTSINQAIEIYSDCIWFYQIRAAIYIRMEDYEQAAIDIKHAENIGRNPAYTLLRKAELALWQQQTSQAVEFSQQALAKRPLDGNFRAVFALTLLANGQTEQANNEMQQALTAIYQPHDFADLLENIDKLIRIYGERAEFSAMRELIATSRKQPNEE